MVDAKIYVTRMIPYDAQKILRELNVKMSREHHPVGAEVLSKEISDVDGLLCFLSDKINSKLIEKAKKLKVISNCAVGYDNIDVKAATSMGIFVTNTPGVLTETTADLTWALLLAVARRIVEADRFVRTDSWKINWGLLMMAGSDVHGKTLGIVGLGRIGEAIARRAKGFNMNLLYHGPNRKLEAENRLNIKYVNLETLLNESDYITVHVPLTKSTFHIIGKKELSLMKKTAYLINTSRGSVTDEKALYEALKNKKIAGAALDVFEKEPIGGDHPFTKLENVVLTPHIGSASVETRTEMAVMAAKNLVRVLKGRMPLSLVNPELLKKYPLEA